MKKLLTSALFLSAAISNASGRGGDGGAVVAGTLGGLMVGSMITSAAADSSNRKTRVEDKIENVQRENDLSKVTQLQREMDKKELEHKLEQQRLVEQQRLATIQQEHERSNSFMYLLLGVIFIMFFAILGLGVLLINMRKRG